MISRFIGFICGIFAPRIRRCLKTNRGVFRAEHDRALPRLTLNNGPALPSRRDNAQSCCEAAERIASLEILGPYL